MKYAKAKHQYEVWTLGQRQSTRFVFETLKQVQLHLLSYYETHKTYSQVHYAMRKHHNDMCLKLWNGYELRIVCIKEL